MNNKTNKKLIILPFITFILGFLFVIFENWKNNNSIINAISYYLYYVIIFLYIIDLFINFIKNKLKIKNNLVDIFFLILIIIFLIYSNILKIIYYETIFKTIIIVIINIRNLLIFFTKSSDKKNSDNISERIILHPAQTVLLSYLIAILFGTNLLMLPISSINNSKIGFIDALFTSTSAISVTGLTVLDTGSKFSFFGQMVILLLIQIGGLGVMILSYSLGFFIGKKLSLEEKMTISFMLNSKDIKNYKDNILQIIKLTFIIEFIGMIFLLIPFSKLKCSYFTKIYYSIFHSISAFCNAGFSLFSDSFINFKTDLVLNITIMILIISGGISFSVMLNLIEYLKYIFLRFFLKKNTQFKYLTINSQIVILMTIVLIFSGTMIIYKLEHKNNLIKESFFNQYLISLFQSVTLRTAGFNTLDISSLQTPTYIIMIIFMFIGGASGSTAGGIKVNTLGSILIYLKSFIKNQKKIIFNKKTISQDIVLKSFLIFFLSVMIILIAFLILSITENFKFIYILFEIVSAFGTVGLSSGITPDLSDIGKLVIIFLMLIGKIGPLSLLAVASQRDYNNKIDYPEGNIIIG